MPPKVKFSEGEKVLCFHGPLLYEAKCLKVDTDEKQPKYFMHYAGWNKSWDEWVQEDRILKFNEQGLARQKELKKVHMKDRKNAKMMAAGPPGKKEKEKEKDKDKDKEKDKKEKEKEKDKDKDKEKEKEKKEKEKEVKKIKATPEPSQEPPRKKRTREPAHVESEESFLAKVEVKIKVPEELKVWLVDDWDLITRQNSLYQLPAKKTVEAILDDYIKLKNTSAKTQAAKDAAVELTLGIREYFNVTLPTQLLYKLERPQYADLSEKHPDKPMSQIFGPIHLLRLFVKLGGMLVYTGLDERCTQLVLTHIHDFLRFLSKNRQMYFSHSDYMPATPEYIRRTL